MQTQAQRNDAQDDRQQTQAVETALLRQEVSYIRKDISDIKTDFKDFRAFYMTKEEGANLASSLGSDIKALQDRNSGQTRIFLLFLGIVSTALIGAVLHLILRF